MKIWFPNPQRTATAFVSAAAVIMGVWVTPTLAGDPFRTNSTRAIDDTTEAAFESMFREGNYIEAREYLRQAELTDVNEPLVYAMLASLAYVDNTEQSWEDLSRYADKTLQAAEQMAATDPLRSNLYTAVGYFLEGTYTFEKEGPMSALSRLQKVFQYLDEAEKIDPQDPELNLITGYMDLMLAVNLPFADLNKAIEKLETYGSPDYLVYRGIAVAYRDLDKHSEALNYANRALQLTPDNPEVLHLKGQILARQDNNREAVEFYSKALEQDERLTYRQVAQIAYEQCKIQRELDNAPERDCIGFRDDIRESGLQEALREQAEQDD